MPWIRTLPLPLRVPSFRLAPPFRPSPSAFYVYGYEILRQKRARYFKGSMVDGDRYPLVRHTNKKEVFD